MLLLQRSDGANVVIHFNNQGHISVSAPKTSQGLANARGTRSAKQSKRVRRSGAMHTPKRGHGTAGKGNGKHGHAGRDATAPANGNGSANANGSAGTNSARRRDARSRLDDAGDSLDAGGVLTTLFDEVASGEVVPRSSPVSMKEAKAAADAQADASARLASADTEWTTFDMADSGSLADSIGRSVATADGNSVGTADGDEVARLSFASAPPPLSAAGAAAATASGAAAAGGVAYGFATPGGGGAAAAGAAAPTAGHTWAPVHPAYQHAMAQVASQTANSHAMLQYLITSLRANGVLPTPGGAVGAAAARKAAAQGNCSGGGGNSAGGGGAGSGASGGVGAGVEGKPQRSKAPSHSSLRLVVRVAGRHQPCGACGWQPCRLLTGVL